MKKSAYLKITMIYFLVFGSYYVQAQYEPSILFYNNSNQLVYVSDEDGNHIPDFSYVGYKNGEEALPNVAVVRQISPVVGDNTAHIQAAIDEVEALPLNANGHRGALLLLPGEYPVNGRLYINSSGVILRGSGDGEDPTSNTIITGVGNIPEERTLITIGTNNKSGFGGQVAGTRQNITSPYLPTGSRTIEVTDASVYNIGDNIIIKHPSTAAWLAAVDNGGVGSDAPWNPGEINLVFNRYITNIDGNKIQVATPIYDILDLSLSQSYVYTYNGNSQIKECGIENLRIFVESSGVTGRNHVKTCINMVGVDNSWVKGVTALRMSDQGVKFDEATRCSVIDTNVLDMHGPISGGWRYNFEVTDHCNNILFENCTASNGRHTFVANGASDVNGIVFSNCSSSGDYTRSESHRRWGQGILWDNISWTNTNVTGILGLHNRGSYGTGHGWTVTNGVAWNISAPSNQIAIQKPPIGQNYAIGCNATVNGLGPFNHPEGFIEGTGENLLIQSLYTAQFEDRTTHGTLPDTPGRLLPYNYVNTDTENYLELTWHDVSIEEDSYILERSSDGTNFQTIATLPANTETYTDTDLQQENYFYRIKATNTIGTSPASNTIQTNDYQSPTQTFYLSATGAGAMDGTSEANAYGNFGTAIANIDSEGDKLIIIGTVPTIGQNLTSKSFAFTIEGLDASSTITGDGGTGRLFTINGATSADVTFKNLTFLNNNTTLAGGAVLFSNGVGAKVAFDKCNFTGNTATHAAGGGALYFANGELNIIDSSFENNTSIDEAGAINGVSGTITITNTLFKSNSAATKGGAIYSSNANFTITGSTFYDNATTDTSGGGSVLYVAGSGSTNSITNCTFFENTVGSLSNQDYGAIRTDNGNTTVTNSLFYDNKTNNGDGAPSDWGSGPNGTQTFNTSIAQWISTNVDNQDEGTGSITGLKGGGGTPADLASSNLTFNATSGYVEYNNVEEGTDSPIDFGSDGNDVGAWDYVDAPSDTTAPVITVLGDNPATVEQGAIYTDAGATADGGETVTTSGTVDTSTVGAYTLTYSATDAANNTGTATRTVNVVVPQNIVYVSESGAGAKDGTSESDAIGGIGTAMSQITSEGDRLIIIGTVPTIGQNLTLKSFAFTIEGLDASSTITGDGGTGRLFTINGATSADVTFKNLTFLNNSTTLAGGAVLFNNNAGAKVTFDNCNFTGNTVANAAGGGALFFANGELNIIDSSFENNTSIDEAGAINGVSGTITITNTLFKSNSAATKGGAIYSSNANFTITGSTFYDNATTNTSGQTGGAAFYVAGVNSTNSITNCTFFENTIALPNNQDYGAIRTDNGNTTVSNSLFYDNKTNNGDGAPSDWGSGPNGTQTFNTSIAQWISTNVDNQDEGAGSITGLKGGGGTPADLASSNLTFNATSGYVEYNNVEEGTDSPIDFGSDGNDVGAWDSGLTLSIDEVLKSKVSVYMNNDSKTIEITHDLDQSLSIKLFSILGSRVMDVKNVSKTARLNADQLKTGVYILIGRSSGNYFSKKLIIN